MAMDHSEDIGLGLPVEVGEDVHSVSLDVFDVSG
jgi:hypothetical protein